MDAAPATTVGTAKLLTLLTTLDEFGGVARIRRVLDAGHGRYAVRAAIAEGSVVRVRRDWIALPSADVYLVAAARAGVVVSCITQARRLGLWVLQHDAPHVA